MATRLAMLETVAQNTQLTLAAMQQDMREMRQTFERHFGAIREEIDSKVGGLRQGTGQLRRALDQQVGELRRVHDRDFRLTFGAIIAFTLGLAALIAHVAHQI